MTTDIKSCEDALRILAAYLDGELDDAANVDLERHLSTCRSCYSRSEFEGRLKGQLAQLVREPVRPELSRRMRDLILTFHVERSE